MIAATINTTETGVSVNGTPVSAFFWLAAFAALAASALGVPLNTPMITFAAAALMLLGGLPHGAFDIAIAMRALRLDRAATAFVLGAYIFVAAAGAALWVFMPTAALALFLIISAVHFGEDWGMLEDGLLRTMAGASIIAAPAIGQPEAVSAFFVLLAGGPQGALLAQISMAAAPVILLVTAVGLLIAAHDGYHKWALAHGAALLCLLITPPVVGFTIYFVLLHSPLHMASLRPSLAGWSRQRFWLYGGAISAVCLLAAAIAGSGLLSGNAANFAADGFRLLAIVAAPHLLLSAVIERQLRRRSTHVASAQRQTYALVDVRP